MNSISKIALVLVIVVAVGLLAACVERASEADVDQMCQRLATLRGGEQGGGDAELITKCKQDAARERPFKSAVDCRTKAVDLDTYWNKCR